MESPQFLLRSWIDIALLLISGVAVVYGVVLGEDSWGVSIYLAFLFVALPLTSLVFLRTHRRTLSVLSVIFSFLLAALCLVVSWVISFISRYDGGLFLGEMLSYVLLGTIVSFACVIVYTHVYLPRKLIGRSGSTLNPLGSGLLSWLGFFAITNYVVDSFTIDAVSLFLLIAVAVCVTPFVYIYELHDVFEGKNEGQSRAQQWKIFVFLVVLSYVGYYVQNEWGHLLGL